MQTLKKGKYQELTVVGRGNFGTAVLVQNVQDQKQYIAKKIILSALSKGEQNQAVAEAELLKKLDHPNIVQYVESFIEDGVLVIVMEYCSVGDLSYHIKKRKTSKEHFQEAEILNWFVQMLLALKYIHSQKILHRDMKSSNVYLTSNNTIKIGDFGISKVLENTQEQALTVVGTPYYMSPEVCESKPYTYKSDVWSLGCILYELCMLKHAFSADNLLGLVYKIVREKIEQIPNCYSNEMQQIINIMLTKDFNQRPSIEQILQLPYIKHSMQTFINSRGNSTSRALKIRKMTTLSQTQYVPQQSPQQEEQFSNSVSTQVKKPQPNETPAQRKNRQKMEKNENNEKKINEATKEAYQQKLVAKQRKMNEMSSSIEFNQINKQNYQVQQQQQKYPQTQLDQNAQNIQKNPKQMIPNKKEPQISSLTQKALDYLIDVDQQVDRMMEESGVDFTLSSNSSMGQTYLQDINTEQNYKNYLQATQGFNNTQDSLSYSNSLIKSAQFKEYNVDNRVISSKDFYQIPSEDEYDEDFEDITAEPNNEELQKVVKEYQGAIDNPQYTQGKSKGLPTIVEESKDFSTDSMGSQRMVSSQKFQIQNLRQKCLDLLGSQKFEQIYNFMKSALNNEVEDESVIFLILDFKIIQEVAEQN